MPADVQIKNLIHAADAFGIERAPRDFCRWDRDRRSEHAAALVQRVRDRASRGEAHAISFSQHFARQLRLVACSPTATPSTRRLPIERIPGAIRAGIITPSLYCGGAESWMLDLVGNSDRRRVQWLGVACVQNSWLTRSVIEQMQKSCPVYGYGPECAGYLFDADVLVAWGYPGLDGLLRGYGGPVVLVSHGSDASWTRNVVQNGRKVATHFVAVSKAARRPFEGLVDFARVTVIHNGINAPRCQSSLTPAEAKQKFGLRPEDIVIGYLGRLSIDEKRPVAIAQAVAKLDHRHKALYVGDGSCETEVRRQIAAILGDRAIFHPRIHEVGDAYRAMDCFVLVSPSEGWCLALGEALYAQVPVIATPVGALPELEQECGRCWEPVPVGIEPEDLARAIRKVLTLPPAERHRRRTLGRRAMTSRYLAPHMAGRWTDYLERVVNEWKATDKSAG